MKGQNIIRVETGHCCVRQQEWLLKCVHSMRSLKENRLVLEDDTLTNRDKKELEVFNAF